MISRFRFIAGAAWLAQVATPAGAVLMGTVDTFEDGTTQGWVSGAGHPSPPVNAPSGGPDGLEDAYLLSSSLGSFGAGSRLVNIAGARWAGDYIAAGVTGIAMDLNNLGDTDLSLRLRVQAPDPTPGAFPFAAILTVPIALPAHSGWTRVTFATTPDAFTGAAADALSGVVEMRLFHGLAAVFPGEASVATLGMDNITAVPEPGAAWLLAGGLLTLALRRRRHD
jgi:hypothetical protein